MGQKEEQLVQQDLQLIKFLTMSSATMSAAPRTGGKSAGRKARPAPGVPAAPARDRVGEMLACVRASGLKLTPQRMAIVRELAANPTHPTAQELYERLRPSLPTMSFATVYNTLDALAAAGLCAALSLAPGPARFNPNMAAHHHAVCNRCGLVRDVPKVPGNPPVSVQSEGELAGDVAPGFGIRAVERIYRGICAECSRALARGAPPGRSKRAAATATG